MKIYLAGPFFTPMQLGIIAGLEITLRAMGYEVYSPREDGVLHEMAPSERERLSQRLFNLNIEKIHWCDLVLAVIDGKDTGTIWEMGFAYGINRLIVTYTKQNFGLNVMLAKCVNAHLRGFDQLHTLFKNGCMPGMFVMYPPAEIAK